MTRAAAAIFLLAVVMTPATSQAQIDHLEVLEAPRLVDCSNAQPYFRVVVNAVDAERRLVGLGLSQDDARKSFEVLQGDPARRATVRYVGFSESGAASGATTGSPGTYVMLLFDTSGSMNSRLSSGQSRFTEAKAAINRSLTNFSEEADHIAVVPFNSRNVVGQIRAAEFQSTRRGVNSQLAAIPTPQANTALYTAINEALPILKARSDGGAVVSLVVFSDGQNDVDNTGDDRGLLGPEGLAVVKARAAELKIPITTVGFGVSRNAAFVNTLRELAWPNSDSYYDAETSAQRLSEIFAIARKKLADRIQILFQPIEDARENLTAQSIQFQVRLRTAQGPAMTRSQLTWDAPAVGVPVFETRCSEAELKAILANGGGTTQPGVGRGSPLGYRIFVLALFSTVLAGLWFGAPRFVWPDSYIPKPTFNRPSSGIAEIDAIRAPTFPPRGNASGPPASRIVGSPAPRPNAPGDPQTIVITPRSAGTSPRGRQAPGSRDAGEETIFRPVDRDPKNDR